LAREKQFYKICGYALRAVLPAAEKALHRANALPIIGKERFKSKRFA
jgi:hypothetical protein